MIPHLIDPSTIHSSVHSLLFPNTTKTSNSITAIPSPTPMLPPTEHTTLLPSTKASFRQFLLSFWPLSLISFGGPQAHVALFHKTFVDKPPAHHPHIPEPLFLELYALSQSLPGSSSTQLITSLGATFGGTPGAFLTFFLWQLPGFLVMTAAGLWFHSHLQQDNTLMIQDIADHAIGLIAAAFSFVLIAAWKIVRKTCEGKDAMAIALLSMFFVVTAPPEDSSWVFVMLLFLGGLVYYLYHRVYLQQDNEQQTFYQWQSNVHPLTASILLLILVLFTILIALLPSSNPTYHILQIFWRIGLTVFGGGIVVIPMLLTEVVASGLLPTSVFLAGFGLLGCVPGPMFNIAPFLGAALASYKGALFGSFGLFGPGILLQIGLLPYWERLRRAHGARVFLKGVNCAAAGLIIGGVWMLLTNVLIGPTAFAITCSAGAASLVYGVGPAKNIIVHGSLGLVLVSLKVGGPFHVQ